MKLLKLCRDGILRINEVFYDEENEVNTSYDIPVDLLENYYSNIFFNVIHRPFYIEEGLTLKELFENFKPYSCFISNLANFNFDNFYEEIIKDPDENNDIIAKEINLKLYLSVEAIPEFKNHIDFSSNEKFNESLQNLIPKTTNQYTFFSFVDIFINENETDYSIMATKLNNISNLTLKLHNNITLVENTQNQQFIKDNENLMNVKNCCVENYPNSNHVVMEHTPTFYEVIINGLFYEIGFFTSPEKRDELFNFDENNEIQKDDNLRNKEYELFEILSSKDNRVKKSSN